ncbi:hypothetical protein [Winogradskyella luteola]|uniref:LTXXQ motif family protein n=1 Tax=Winogradskyella luteola TaxID=2828330 RepID=A0A9X1JNE8_9FLAO|nr:hypothetical protein [Winogradskyella luteola]MBV7269336.1 hypothetical protein [Winogradskyella luteola]
MKKIFTLCLFAIAMLIGTQTVSAQSTTVNEIKADAEKKTESLRKLISLEKTQMDDVYSVLVEYGKATTMQNNPDNNSLEKAESTLMSKMKQILTEEQFDRYMALEKKS